MSLYDDLGLMADVSNILASQQRANMLAVQVAQLEALHGIQHQAQIAAARAEQEKALQDMLFYLHKALPSIAGLVADDLPQAVEKLCEASMLLEYLPPDKFSGLEWKQLSVTAQNDVNAIATSIQAVHGEPGIQLFVDTLANKRQAEASKHLRACNREAFLSKERALRADKETVITGILYLVNISAGIVLMFAWIGAVVGDDSKSHGIAWFCFITFVFAVCVNVFMHFTRRRLRKKAAEIEALYANAE